jgi:galactokinase
MRHLRDELAAAGLSPEEAERKSRLLAATRAALDARGIVGPPRRYWVPGRIEVLGKHTDYAGGRGLLCAAERGFVMSVAPREDHVVSVIDVVHNAEASFELTLDQPPCPHWHNYPATVVRRIVRNFPAPLHGCDIAIASDLPRASGMSSSTAFIIAVFLAVADRNALDARPDWDDRIASLEELAAYLGAIENGASYGDLAGDRGVGTHGGSQDHTAILCAVPGHVVGYRFGPVQREASVPLGDRVFVIGASGITASKAGEHRERYNQAVEALQVLLELWRMRTGETPVTLGALLDEGADTVARLRGFIEDTPAGAIPVEVLRNRLEQFIAEAHRLVPGATRALAAGDFTAFGTIVDESQHLAEQWLGNQIPETSALARLARRLGAEGASAFGAGFGGSVWALVPDREAERFCQAWRSAYEAEFPMLASRASFFRSHAGPAVLRL